MNKEEAIQEVTFIKKLLEDTGREIIKNGWAFIWVGLALFITATLFGYGIFYTQIYSDQLILFGIILISIEIIEVIIGILIYRRTVARWSSVTLEKQIWQIWTWAILITLVVFGIMIKRTDHLLNIGFTSISPNNMNVAILVALATTGVLTNKPFFYQLTVLVIILNWVVKIMPETWHYLSLISSTINILLPLCGTGIYFLILNHKFNRKEIARGLE